MKLKWESVIEEAVCFRSFSDHEPPTSALETVNVLLEEERALASSNERAVEQKRTVQSHSSATFTSPSVALLFSMETELDTFAMMGAEKNASYRYQEPPTTRLDISSVL